MSLWWIFALLITQRLSELWIAERNKQALLARGGREFFAETYRSMIALHLLFLLSLVLESFPWHVPLNNLTFVGLFAITLLQACRYWCIVSLGIYWNTRIIVQPGAKVIRCGPYRYIRHPNYLVVGMEFIAIPLVMRAPVTLVLFSLMNLIVLRQRIRHEERALRENTDYGKTFLTKKQMEPGEYP
jgi:methyltransferase